MADGDLPGSVILRDRFEIDPRQPLPAYDAPTALAYRAGSSRDGRHDLVALVCDPDVPPRVEAMAAMRALDQRAVQRLLEWGVAPWPLTRRRHMIVILEQPQGERVVRPGAAAEAVDEDRLVAGFLSPLVPALREMAGRGVTHRNIRPANLFYADARRRLIMLGECVTAPPGYNQPTWVEPIESGMALPSGRGPGTAADDLYALGATLLALLLGGDPAPQVLSEALLDAKINAGSYAALVGERRVSRDMVELLRGLLSDDPRERWKLREVELWLGGRRLTPKQAKLPPRASRPLVIEEREHHNARALANALALNWAGAAEVIASPGFEIWVTRSLGSPAVAAAVQKAAGPSGSDAEKEATTTRVAIALDPAAPIRHKGIGIHLDAVGTALAVNLANDPVRQVLAEVLAGRFALLWLALQPQTHPEQQRFHDLYERLPRLLAQTTPGYGLERCLYELNPYQPCRSPLIAYQYVTHIEELLPALEVAAQQPDRPSEPVDRHIAAFVAARLGPLDEGVLRQLGARDNPVARAMATVKLLARVQATTRGRATPSLTAWCALLMRPAVTAFHNLKVRKTIEESLKRAATSGLLPEMQAIFDDPRLAQMDERGYARAVTRFSELQGQIAALRREADRRDIVAANLGKQAAAVLSGLIAGIVTLGFIVPRLF